MDESLPTPTDLILLGDARVRLGVSKVTMARIVEEGWLTIYLNPTDKRQKLVSASEVERLRTLRPIRSKPSTPSTP